MDFNVNIVINATQQEREALEQQAQALPPLNSQTSLGSALPGELIHFGTLATKIVGREWRIDSSTVTLHLHVEPLRS